MIAKNRARGTEDVAEYFRQVLLDQGFNVLFDQITFAIYDKSGEHGKINAFEKALLNK